MHAVLEFTTELSCQLLNVVLEGQAVEYRLQPFLAVCDLGQVTATAETAVICRGFCQVMQGLLERAWLVKDLGILSFPQQPISWGL